MNDLLGSAYKGKVAIKGDPTQANEAASAVYLAAAQTGGSADDIQPGIDFFGKLKKAGNLISVLPTQATVNSGQTPVVIQWSFNNVAWGAAGGSTGNPNWKTVVLPGTAIGSYYNQSINKNAPNPAAARLWEEYIYTPDGAEPVPRGRRLPGAARRDAEGRHGRRGHAELGRRAAGRPGAAHRGPGDEGRHGPEVRLVEGHRLIR